MTLSHNDFHEQLALIERHADEEDVVHLLEDRLMHDLLEAAAEGHDIRRRARILIRQVDR